MATARPLRDDPAAAPEREAVVREGLAALGRVLLEAALQAPPPWPAPDPTEDLDEPALIRKQRRQRRERRG